MRLRRTATRVAPATAAPIPIMRAAQGAPHASRQTADRDSDAPERARAGLRRRRAHGPRLRSLPAILTIAAIAALGASAPASARPPANTPCDSFWMHATGTSGFGAAFEISMRPKNSARVAPAHPTTPRIWDAMWRCVPGGYPRARVDARQGESLYQQLYCHVKYGYHPAFGGDTWDLEAYRPPIDWNRIFSLNSALQHRCNW